MVFSGFCFVSLRLPRSIYASIISRRSPCLPCITPENPHSSFRSSQTFKTLQKKLNQALDGLVPVRSIHYCTYTPGLSTLSSTRRLTDLCHERSHLGVGFTLRCFQRLSDPDVATQRYAWRHNWYTIGPSTYHFNGRTAQPLGPTSAPGCDEPTSRCQTSPSIWTLGRDQPVIPRVAFIR